MQLRYASSRRLILATAVLAVLAAPSYVGVANARPVLPGSWSVSPTSVAAGSGPMDFVFRYTARTTTTDGSASASVAIPSDFGVPQTAAPTGADFVTLVKGTCNTTSAHITIYDSFTPPRVAIEGFKCTKANQFTQFALKKVTAPTVPGAYSFPTYYYSSGVGTVVALAPVTITVTPGAPTQLVFVPASPGADVGPFSFIAGNTMQTTAVAIEDAFNNIVPTSGTNISVSSTPLTGTMTQPTTNGVATFDDLTGTLAGLSYGFTATSGALTPAVGAFNIYPADLDYLVLSPADDTIQAGDSDTYSAEGFDAFDNDLGDVTGDTVFTIDTGSCSGVSTCTPPTVAGVYTVTGTDGTATGSTSLTVEAGPLDHLVLAPDEANIIEGESQTYTAEGYDAYDNDIGDVTGDTTFDVGGDTSQCTGATCTPTGPGGFAYAVNGTDGTATGWTYLNVSPTVMTTFANAGDANYLSKNWPGFLDLAVLDWYDLPSFTDVGVDETGGTGPSVAYSPGTLSYIWDDDMSDNSDATTDTNRAVTDPGDITKAATRYSADAFSITLHYDSAYLGVLYLYFVDWDSTTRQEDVTVEQPTHLAQSAHLASFDQGVWAMGLIDVAAGDDVTITVTHTSGAGDNAVISAILTQPLG